MTITSRRVTVTNGYHCPFCKNHQDKVFYQSVLIDLPICEGCSEELFHLSHSEKQPNDSLIEKVENYTAKTWDECRIILLRDTLEQWNMIYNERPTDWLTTTMKHFNLDEDGAWKYVQNHIRWYTELVIQAEKILSNNASDS